MDRTIESTFNIHYMIIVNGTQHERDFQQKARDKQHAERQFLQLFTSVESDVKIINTNPIWSCY